MTNRRLYCILLWARPRGFFFLSCLATFGVCPLTLPARASDPWTLPANCVLYVVIRRAQERETLPYLIFNQLTHDYCDDEFLSFRFDHLLRLHVQNEIANEFLLLVLLGFYGKGCGLRYIQSKWAGLIGPTHD